MIPETEEEYAVQDGRSPRPIESILPYSRDPDENPVMSCDTHFLLFYYLYSQRDMSDHQAVLEMDTPQETREYRDAPLTPGRTPPHGREDGKPARRLKTESQGDGGEMARLRGAVDNNAYFSYRLHNETSADLTQAVISTATQLVKWANGMTEMQTAIRDHSRQVNGQLTTIDNLVTRMEKSALVAALGTSARTVSPDRGDRAQLCEANRRASQGWRRRSRSQRR